jgi:TM2 domain-containing membrane protein YozV
MNEAAMTSTSSELIPASTPSGSGSVPSDARTLIAYDANKRSVGVAYLLWFFLGGFGGHRFYNGRAGTGVVLLLLTLFGLLLLLFGGVGALLLVPVWIWVLVDAFLIPGWVRKHNNLLAEQLRVS